MMDTTTELDVELTDIKKMKRLWWSFWDWDFCLLMINWEPLT
jgi:hypothetical protein